MKKCFLLLGLFLSLSSWTVSGKALSLIIPNLGEDPQGAGLFIVMGICVVVMIAMLVFGKKKKSDDDKK